MTTKLGVGIIGCGNISATYAKLLPLFSTLRLVACADINHSAAQSLAEQHQLQSRSVDDLLGSDDIDIVLNLTVPAMHMAVTLQILQAGKHAYSEKPLALSLDEAQRIAATAAEAKLKVGGAADTILGGSHQLARNLLDTGKLGTVHSAACHFLSPGMESWHPNPDFFFAPGGGPVLDMGPYYIGSLLNLIGPIKRVAALASIPRDERVIGSGPRKGETIKVQIPTTYHCLLELADNVAVSYTTGWDVYGHRHPYMELYGTSGALFMPDPNFFGGDVTLVDNAGNQNVVPAWDHPFAKTNFEHGAGQSSANYRGAGLADMARAIIDGGEHRCSLERCLHVVEVMTGLMKAAQTGSFVDITTQCTRPEALEPAQAKALLD